LNQRPHPYQVSRAKRCADRRFPRSLPTVRGEGMRSSRLRSKRCRQARLAYTPIGDSSISPPAVAEVWPADAGDQHDQTEQSWSKGGTDPSVNTPRTWPRAQRHPKPLQRAIPTLPGAVLPDPAWRGAGGQRAHGRAAAPCPAHRRSARPPPTRTSRLTKADAAGVVSGRTLSGQSWWQAAQPRASSPAAPNAAPG
jgi:hypothetical protein